MRKHLSDILDVEYLDEDRLLQRIKELHFSPSKNFEIKFVTPHRINPDGTVIQYMFCYIFIARE